MINYRGFYFCCGGTVAIVSGKPSPYKADRNIDTKPNSAQIVWIAQGKDTDQKAWETELVTNQGFKKHESGAFFYRNAYKDWDPKHAIYTNDKGKLKTFPITEAEAARDRFKRRLQHCNYQTNANIPMSIIGNFQFSRSYQDDYRQAPKRLDYLAEIKEIEKDGGSDNAHDRITPLNEHVFLDLACEQIAWHHDQVIEAGYTPLMYFLNRNYDSRNIIYYKQLKKAG